MRDPAFLFYPSDFLTGCTNLTMEERGQYISLLCIQHQTGHLSEKTIRLSVGNVSVDLLSKFQQDENGLYFNARLEKEIEKRSQFVDSRRVNGSKGGRPQKPLGLPSAKPYGKPDGKPTEKLIEDVNVNEIINIVSSYFESKYINNETKKVLLKLLESYKKEDIINSIVWAKKDDFWNTNFLSISKLNKRDKNGVKYIDVFLAKSKTISSQLNPENKTGMVFIDGQWKEKKPLLDYR